MTKILNEIFDLNSMSYKEIKNKTDIYCGVNVGKKTWALLLLEEESIFCRFFYPDYIRYHEDYSVVLYFSCSKVMFFLKKIRALYKNITLGYRTSIEKITSELLKELKEKDKDNEFYCIEEIEKVL